MRHTALLCPGRLVAYLCNCCQLQPCSSGLSLVLSQVAAYGTNNRPELSACCTNMRPKLLDSLRGKLPECRQLRSMAKPAYCRHVRHWLYFQMMCVPHMCHTSCLKHDACSCTLTVDSSALSHRCKAHGLHFAQPKLRSRNPHTSIATTLPCPDAFFK